MYVLIEHYLKQEGRSFFSSWFEKVRIILKDYKGFIFTEQLQDDKNPDRNLILLKFDSIENLKYWANSDDHKQLIEELSPFMEREYNSQLYKVLL